MTPPSQPLPTSPDSVPAQLLAAWPAETWQNVHVLAAVSGGADSMALLRALLDAKHQCGGTGQVFAGHVNHGLRGDASEAEQQFVADVCRGLAVPLEVRRAAPLTDVAGTGLEGAARAERHRLLLEMAETVGARYLAMAHTRDDQAETVLFRLLRGSGLRGLSGMRSIRPLSPAVVLVRPLLGCSRGALRDYLHSIDQPWREDASNAELQYRRNRIRGELLPYLREHFNPDADEAIVRAGAMIDEAQQLVERLATTVLARCRRPIDEGILLSVGPLVGESPLVVGEAIRIAWREAGWAEQAMTYFWWRRLAQLGLSSDASETLALPGNVLACRQGDLLTLAPSGRLS